MKKYLGILAAAGFLLISLVASLQQEHSASGETIASSQTVASSSEKEQARVSQKSKDFPKVSLDDWALVLVGPLNKGTEIDTAEKAGHPLVMISAFRSIASQKAVFDQNVTMLMSQGQNKEKAIETTKRTMTEPGYSEHHTGLAVDVVDRQWYDSYPETVLDHRFGETDGGKWLQAHAREYGFIIRYPEGKQAITQIDYEPWHLRYVGVETATYIEKHQLTLEEFLEQVKEQEEENE